MNNQLLEEGYKKSIKGLLENSTKHGLLAASPKDFEGQTKNYTSLFSRDIGVCSLGILASGKEELYKVLRVSLENLVKAQSKLGQFPFYCKPEQNVIRWWTPGALDSTLWWCIAFLEYYKKTQDKKFYETYKENLEKAFTYLTYQDTNNDTLLEQGEASDWADEMPRRGIVLYSNSLWYWLLRLRVEVEGRKDLKNLKEKVYEAFNTILWVHKEEDNTLNYVPDNEYTKENVFANGFIEYIDAHTVFLPYYLGFVSHKTFEMRCDVYGNILACLSGVADEKKTSLIVDAIFRSGANLPYPVKVLYPPIYPGEHDWEEYMSKGRQNYPWQYHNGGIWPYVGGFWVMLLSQIKHPKAQEELVNLAKANKVNNWEFNEYLHGQLGTPMGIAHQSWNMGMYIAAYKSLNK